MTASEKKCRRIAELVSSGQSVTGEDDLSHVGKCEECSARLGMIELSALPSGLEPASFDAMSSLLAREKGVLGKLRSLSLTSRLSVLVLLSLFAASFQMIKPRADLLNYPGSRMIGIVLIFAAMAIWVWRLGLRPLHRPPPRKQLVILLTLLLAILPLAVSLLPEALTHNHASLGGVGPDLVSKALACFLYGSVFAMPALVFGAVADRSSLSQTHSLFAFIGAPALVANLALQLHCPLTHPTHLVLGHASISLFFVLVAGFVWLVRRKAN